MVQAVRHVEQALDRAQEFLTTSLPTLSERQRIELLTSTQYVLATFLSLTAGSTERDEAVYRRLLFWKGLAGADAAARRLIAATPEIRSNVLELNQVRAELNSLTYARIAPERRQQQERQLSEVRERRERLESELARASGWKPDAPAPREVADALPDHAVLVDLFRYNHFSPPPTGKGPLKREPRYAAFVIAKETLPRRIELKSATDIDRAIDAWCAEPKNGPNHADSRRLAQLVWQPLAPYVDGTQLVLVAPDGQFNFLPWGVLPDLNKRDGYLIQRCTFAAVSSGRQVVDLARRSLQPAPDRLLAVGGVDYNHHAPADAIQIGSRPPLAGAASTRAAAFVGNTTVNFPPLPGTLPEANDIADLFRRAGGSSTKLLSGREATKEAIRAGLHGHRYIHLATHGYFAPSPSMRLTHST